ncbi:MAG: HlyD family type I secretion periplasmic adaptor subunit [Rhizobiales bacterium]|nr:HlyD family type I secretion periplasmic adaptor subunit [Hyphomicrobiales bacterium]
MICSEPRAVSGGGRPPAADHRGRLDGRGRQAGRHGADDHPWLCHHHPVLRRRLLWAGLAPLSSGAIAQGVVSVAGNRKTIQHLEGGIVEALHVQEGDSVRVGEILIQLNDTQARTTLDLLRTQYAALKLQEARLQAELTDQPTMHFSFEGVEIADSQTVQQIFHDQLDIFASRRAKLENQVGLLQQRISLQNLEIKGLEAQIDSSRKQLGLIRQELVTVQDLVDRGLATRSRMFALQREEAGLEAGVVQQETQIAATAGAIQEVKAQIADLYAARFEQAAVEILEARDKLAEVQERLPAARETFERTQLLAPISGRVVNLKVHTIGGVIAPGTPVLDIVPDDDQLVIEAHLDPKDRDVIAAGMPAEVRFTAFNQRVSMPVKGRVAWISADSIVDERTGLHHYVARVELIEDPARALKGGAVYPGMQANVMIVAGEKTALSYLFRPLAQMMTGAFREQ